MYRQLDLNSYQFEPVQCKHCGSYAVVRNGFYRGTRKQVYKCKRCNCRFVYNYSDLEKMRFHSKIIAFAVELYTTTGISLRTLARKMKEYFGIGASYEAIRLWVRKAAKRVYIPRLHKLNARFWCVDETMIRVNGSYIWLWVVLDPENKVVIAWHTSRVRTLNDAVTLLRKAFRRTANVPWQIITDNLPHYRRAIAKVFCRGNKPNVSLLAIETEEHYGVVKAKVEKALILFTVKNKDSTQHTIKILGNFNYYYSPTNFEAMGSFVLKPKEERQFQIPYYRDEQAKGQIIAILVKCLTCKDKVEMLKFVFGSKEKLKELEMAKSK